MTNAVVVGSGPNGLCAAIRLAQVGTAVTVVEANERIGGGTRTEELTVAGLRHDVCAAFHPTGAASPYLNSLGLERHGLRWLWPQIDLAHPLDDGRAGLAARDMTATRESLGIDAARWEWTFEPAVRRFPELMDEIFQPVLHLPKHPVTLARFGVGALAPASVLGRTFQGDPARALFTGAAAHAFNDLRKPLTSSVGLLLTTAAHAVGWPVAEGGTESITRALLAELAELGGTVVTGHEVCDLGELRQFVVGAPDIVMFDTAPAGVLRIVGDRLPERIRRAFSAYRYGPAAFKVDYAIEGDIPWINEQLRRAGTVHLGGSAEQIIAAEAETVAGRLSDTPFVLLGQQYLVDPSRSVGNVNPIYAYAHVPHGYPGDATESVTRQIERFAPGFRDRILATASVRATEWESYNANYVGGDISAGANLARQLVFRPRATLNPYSLGVPGLYLCSAATPPGAGVHGMAGFNAAESALSQLR